MEPVHADNQANNEIISFLNRGGAHGHNSPTSFVDALRIDDMLEALQIQQQQEQNQIPPRAISPPYQHPFRQLSPEMRQVYPPKVI